jgi:hypothetical protein
VGPGWGRETPVRSLIEESPITYIKDIMKLSYFYPLLGFVVLTVAIGFGLVIPRSCIAGINDLTIGFAMTIAGACLSYWIGLRTALRDVTLELHRANDALEWRVRITVQHEGETIAPS